jgi:hypothetical protein
LLLLLYSEPKDIGGCLRLFFWNTWWRGLTDDSLALEG